MFASRLSAFLASLRGPALLLAGLTSLGLAGPAEAATVSLSAPASVNQGSTANFSAIVEGELNVPTGTVTFTVNGTSVGSGSLSAENYLKVVASYGHACAITVHGALQCFGINGQGQLGTGNATDSLVPVTILTKNVTDVAVGNGHSCAVVNGAVKCWGANGRGQLGNGTITPSLTFVEVFASGATAVAAGGFTTCAVVSGNLHCWGANGYGQVGNGNGDNAGSGTDVTSPNQVLTGNVTAVSVGDNLACAIQSAALYCWGLNVVGSVGDGTTTNRNTPTRVIDIDVEAVSAGGGHTCAISSGTLYCWGLNTYGQVGIGNTSNQLLPVEIPISGGSGATVVSAGIDHTCAVQSGVTRCWGRNINGQLGDTSTTDRASQVDVSNLITGAVSALGAGEQNTCAIQSGALYCWGTGGRNGDGTSFDSPEPLAATRRLAYAAVTSTALRTAGTLPVVASYGGAGGESAADSATAQLVVNDREAPKIGLPANQTIQVDIDSTTARFNYTVSVTDNISGSITLRRTAGPASGAGLPLGATTFTFSATDAANNSVTRSFVVTVIARKLNGGNGNDSLYGSANADTINGGDGNDLLDGKRGADTMNGGKGNDTYYVDNAGDKVVEKTGEGTDKVITALTYTLPANVENLTLTGSAAVNGTGNELENTIEGDIGANRLTGSGDADVIKGGKGADRFVYEELSDSTARDPDTISDFRKTDKDRIDLTAIDANSRKAGNQAFTFIEAEAFSKTAGELRFAKRRLEADVNGDGKADFVIKVQTRSLTAKEILR